jgi:hypothetical protein
MRTSIIVLASLLAFVGAASFASAGPVTDGCHFVPGGAACISEYSGSFGCFSYGSTSIYAFTGAGFASVGGGGESVCGWSYSEVGGSACTYAAQFQCVFFGWYGYNSGYCGMYEDNFGATGYGFQDLPCVAGAPPNPGWGSLLP